MTKEKSNVNCNKTLSDDRLRDKIFKASQYIENNLNEPLKVSKIAKEVGLSVSHFHMAFKTIVGEAVMQHILRLRVEYAASLLKYSSWQAGDIALVSGFKSAASFSRSFKQILGISPQQFRKKRCVVPFLQGYLRTRPDLPLQNKESVIPTARIEKSPQMQAICLRYFGPVDQVYKPWKELLSWANSNIKNLHESRFLGLWFDDWSDSDDDHYRYECAIVIDSLNGIEVPKPYFVRYMPAGKVAVAYSKGKLNILDKSWKAFATGWLPYSGLQPRGQYVFDEYKASFMLKSSLFQFVNVITGQIELNMNIPVQKDPLNY